MKKTITILLLTALCITVFTSCDLGGGLVAELLGQINQEHVLVDPSVDHIIQTPPLPPVEQTAPIETAPPMLPEPKVIDFMVESVGEKRDGRVHLQHLVNTNKVNPDSFVMVRGDIDVLVVDGWIGISNVDTVMLGYSVNGENAMLNPSFQKDPDPERKEILYQLGADYLSAYSIELPMDDLKSGMYEITLLFGAYPNEAGHDSERVVTEFFTFKVYKDSAYDDETACG